MLDPQSVLKILNKTGYTEAPFLAKWRNIFYRISIHTTGACPRFAPLRYVNADTVLTGAVWEYPSGWLNEHYDYIFDNNLLNKHPREAEVTRQWRKSVYRPFQMAPMLECINTTAASIFGESKWTLVVDNKDDNDYIYGNNFDGKSLVGYFNHHFKTICEDPNSLFVVVPKQSGADTTSTKIEPEIKHIPSRDIAYINDTEIVYRVFDSPYAWWVNDVGYFLYSNETGTFTLHKDYYAHLLLRRPVHFAGGIWNSQKYYDSYLKAAQAFCDEFVSSYSSVQMVNKEACHPFIIESDVECPSCNGLGQVNFCYTCNTQVNDNQCSCTNSDNYDWRKGSCVKCNGSGTMSHNPADRMVVPKKDMVEDLIKIVSFDTGANEHLSKVADTLALGIRKSLHMQYVDEAQSGVAKDIDRSSQFLYRSAVSNGIWGLIEKCLIDILSIRNSVNGQDVDSAYTLVKPTDFDLKTDYDLLEEYKESTLAKTPDWVRQKQIEQYVDKCFGGDAKMVKMSYIINQLDPFSVTPMLDKSALLSSGGISSRDFQYSNELPKILNKICRDKGTEWFINAQFNDIEAEITTIFASIPEIVPPIANTKLNVNT